MEFIPVLASIKYQTWETNVFLSNQRKRIVFDRSDCFAVLLHYIRVLFELLTEFVLFSKICVHCNSIVISVRLQEEVSDFITNH